MEDASTTLLPGESEDLREARDTELKKVLKLKLVLDELRRLDLGPNPSAEIKRALKLVSIGSHARLGEIEVGGHEQVLGLQNGSSYPPLSYTDRKTVRTKLSAQLRSTLKPIAELGDKMREEFPDAFGGQETDLTRDQKEILRLEEEQRSGLQQLVTLLGRKCSLLKDSAELKLGPQMANELKLQQAQAQLVQLKAEVLRDYLVHESASRTDNSVKAHKEVEAHLDELLAAQK
ncbi:augmin complex subunit dgt2 [Drosophila takahashii]|uniref:augmin complex subunit dgt2 n=1 Tax=Drosophila takahashii TaxID=29030 RepID=UPI001CF8B3E3|nr:augmin complex subunit dgt2 [Drosophila takahashii]